MAYNVMQEYIKLTQDEITSYMKLILENRYNKRIVLEFMDAYKNVRFYNFYPKDDNLTFRKNYLNAMKDAEERIKRQIPEKIKLTENIGLFFYYILYFDKISYKTDINEMIEKLYKLRKKILKKDNEEFKKDFYNVFEIFKDRKEYFLSKFESEDFYLKISDYEGAGNVHRVNLKYNIKFPMIYSQQAIDNTFNSGLTNEDKLLVEYNLISKEIIEEILKGNFKKQYIIEFSTSLLEKKKKLRSIINILENSAVQDKVNLKVTYKEFKKYKQQIYDLMREGFRFSVILDNTFEPEYIEISKLDVFNYCIASSKLSYYDTILANQKIIKNLIKI